MIKKWINKYTVTMFILGAILFNIAPISAAVNELVATESQYKLMLNDEEYNPASIPLPAIYCNSKNYTALSFVYEICKKAGISYKVDLENKTINFNTNLLTSATVTKSQSTLSSNSTKSAISTESALTLLQPKEKYVTPDEEIGGGAIFKTPPTTILPEDMEWIVYSPINTASNKYWCIKYNNDIYMEESLALGYSGCEKKLIKSSEIFVYKYDITNSKKSIPYNVNDQIQQIFINNKHYLNYSWLQREFN